MITFAFIFGVLPLVLAHGAGTNSRRILGTTVLGGVFAATPIIPVTLSVPERFATKLEKTAVPAGDLPPIHAAREGLPAEGGRR
jgi:HAE1 family hydrophobic/amphiphilic exporter-1